MRPTDRHQVFGLSALSVSPDHHVRASRAYCSTINWSAEENCLALWFYGHVLGRKSPEQNILLTLLLQYMFGSTAFAKWGPPVKV